MSQSKPSLVLITILPALALIPVLVKILTEIHSGGLHLLFEFFSASVHPSLHPVVIHNAWRGLQVTIATALLSWIFSMLGGIILGLLSSNIFWKIFEAPPWQPILIRRLLAIPRSIHELIWGLLLLQLFGMSTSIAIIAICIPYSSLVARVLSDQIDSLDHRSLMALRQGGVAPLSALTTALLPAMIPIINSYGGYRLECALRGATMLGVFGMGGIGTELQLTLQSLEFKEMWTSLWMLGGVMFTLETILNWRRMSFRTSKKINGKLWISLVLMFTTIGISWIWLQSLDIQLIGSFIWHPIPLPTIIDIKYAIMELPWIDLISSTLLITILAAGIAIGTPPLGMMLFPNQLGQTIQKVLWAFLRLIPPPLSALLLLLCTSPSLSVASLALGLHNLGVMGRLLNEGINQQSNNIYGAIKCIGSGDRLAWLHGHLCPQTKSYLAYAAYRADVLLRETAVVGVVGGAGLGWQLQESLSSFDWSQVAVITTTFSLITLVGESMSEKVRHYWLKPANSSQKLLIQS
ncbi:phosphonate ABC transporter [Prochlorococcus sp. MIT 1307]|uniref:phosphonate ABC transporter n=1 Tax=Prochlorococcus sp. MIT 1307 TaxID=3096219 RepID=UPI002A74CDD6|nr:phosphonate ABC transporter [Prochlorococcus sp. MIT 1307]